MTKSLSFVLGFLLLKFATSSNIILASSLGGVSKPPVPAGGKAIEETSSSLSAVSKHVLMNSLTTFKIRTNRMQLRYKRRMCSVILEANKKALSSLLTRAAADESKSLSTTI